MEGAVRLVQAILAFAVYGLDAKRSLYEEKAQQPRSGEAVQAGQKFQSFRPLPSSFPPADTREDISRDLNRLNDLNVLNQLYPAGKIRKHLDGEQIEVIDAPLATWALETN